MKKFVLMAVAAIAFSGCLALAGCSSDTESAPADDASKPAADAAQAETEKADSKYAVAIEGATVGADYEGNPVVIVTYSWTNNSDEATSAMAALYAKCFQNGVELETAIVTEDIGADNYMAEVKPGAGTTYGIAYALDDQSDVTVEVSEFISFDDAILASETFSVA